MFSMRAFVSYLAFATAMTGVLAAPADINSCNGLSNPSLVDTL
jgi:hypothetical protein